VNAALAAHGHDAILVKAGGYFFFRGPEVNAWLDRTVQIPKISDLSVEEWLRAFLDLKRKNQEIARAGRPSNKRTGAHS
jgi:hypothetical protein